MKQFVHVNPKDNVAVAVKNIDKDVQRPMKMQPINNLKV